MNEIIEKFTTHLRSVIVRSVTLAEENSCTEVSLEHLLYALATERGSLGAEILQKTKIKVDALLQNIQKEVKNSEKQSFSPLPEFGKEAKRTLEKAVLTASLHDHAYVGTEHLLAAIAQSEMEIKKALELAESDLKIIKRELEIVLKTTSKFPDLTSGFEGTKGARATREREGKGKKSKTPALDFFAVDLMQKEAQERIDPVIGREAEIARVIQILSRRTKNNPILLGDPGVGKTAIVEGLSKLIKEGNVPDVLLGKRIFSLDLALLISGTVYRGEFESRLKQVLDEAKQNTDIILFIDEVHMIVGAGAASGSLDAANILKPALARGELRAIGATTFAEFKRHIETDSALERRFQPIVVGEPNFEETVAILNGLKERYELFHKVIITDAAIRKAVELSGRYIQDKYFPDKAIDLIDEAAAAKKIITKNETATETAPLIKEREELQKQKEQAVALENFKLAIELKAREAEIERQLSEMRKNSEFNQPDRLKVYPEDIAKVVSRITRIPESDLLGRNSEPGDLEYKLKQKICGQDQIISSIVSLLERAKADLRSFSRPLASFLFLGPTGVGKTELAKVLAHNFFGNKDSFIRIDMSEFREPFQMSKLIGAPAGYVGYRESTKLTDMVKSRSYSLVLFDEIEKAHPDVLNLLLAILEEGELSDAIGRKINFRNTIIAMTSNLGSQHFKKTAVGFGEEETSPATRVIEEIKNILRPEFINRIDQIHVFNELKIKEMEQIVELQIDELNLRLKEKGLKLVLSPSARVSLAALALSKKEGARAVRRIIEEKVEGAIAKTLLQGKVAPGTIFTLKAAKGSVQLGSI